MGIKIFENRIKSLEEAALKILNEAGFGYGFSSSNQPRFKTASNDDEYFERKAERDAEAEEDNLRRRALRKKMNTPKVETDENGEYSPLDSKGRPIPQGKDALSTHEYKELQQLKARERERKRQNRFQAAQRSRRKSKERTDLGIAQSRRLAGR